MNINERGIKFGLVLAICETSRSPCSNSFCFWSCLVSGAHHTLLQYLIYMYVYVYTQVDVCVCVFVLQFECWLYVPSMSIISQMHFRYFDLMVHKIIRIFSLPFSSSKWISVDDSHALYPPIERMIPILQKKTLSRPKMHWGRAPEHMQNIHKLMS